MNEQPKPFRVVKEVTIKQVIEAEGGELSLEGIKIAGEEYKLRVENHCRIKGEGQIRFNFNDGDFQITIDERGIRFERECHRPNHDHGDTESYQIGTNDSIQGCKKGERIWRSRSPTKRDGYEHFYIPFGCVVEK